MDRKIDHFFDDPDGAGSNHYPGKRNKTRVATTAG